MRFEVFMSKYRAIPMFENILYERMYELVTYIKLLLWSGNARANNKNLFFDSGYRLG